MSPESAASQLEAALPRAPDAVLGRRRTRRRTPAGQRAAVHAVVAAAAVGAAVLTDARPTELWLIDAMYRALFAGGMAWIGSRARRLTWPLLAGAAVLLAGSWLTLAAAVAAAAAAATTLRGPRNRVVGAVVSGVAGIVLLDIHLPGPDHLETLLAAAIVVPVAWSAWTVLPPVTTRRIRRVGAIVVIAAGVSVAAAVLAIVFAASDLRRGVESSQAGLEAVRDGSVADARAQLDQAADDLGQASAWLTSPLAQPARLVPIAGQHVRAAQVTSAEATALTAAAAEAAAVVDTERLRPVDGAIDLAAFDPAVAPLERLDLTVQRAVGNLAAIESPWLLPPAAGPLDELRRGLDRIAPAAEVAAVAARELPTLLGRDGRRDYLVLLTTPAEARGSGGFIGSWVIVTAEQGRVRLTETGRAADVNRALERTGAELEAPLDYQARWARFDPAGHFQDITLSPDFPTVAGVAASLVRQTDRPVDGVLAIDPYGLEALLAFTGPVPVAGTDHLLTERDAAEWLLTEQYEAFDDDEARQDALAETAGDVFESLLAADFPSIGAVRDVLGPAVAADRVTGWTDGAERFFAVSGLDGAFPVPDEVAGDFVAVTHQNSAQNKIDPYLRRTVEYRASVSPDTGEVVATATVTLENTAPTRGLAASVLGSNDQGLPAGTNRLYLSIYSPHLITGARVDGEDHLMETNIELGWQTYATFLEIPAGETVELELDLVGRVDGPYQLTVEPQALVHPDRVVVDVRELSRPLLQADTTSDRRLVLDGTKS